jgi:hypothetical protein
MTLAVYDLPYQENLIKNITCTTAFNVARSKMKGMYTQSFVNGLGINKEYALEYQGLLDTDTSGTLPNLKTIEDLFSIQQTNTVLAWCPPTESMKTAGLATGTIKTDKYSTEIIGVGTNFSALTVNMYLFSSYSYAILAGTALEQTFITDTFLGVVASIQTATKLTLKKLAKETTTELYNTDTSQYRTSVGFKVITPQYFYMPTSWEKVRKETIVGNSLIFNSSLKFKLTSVY